MYGRVIIQTKGVQGAGMLLREFTAGLMQRFSPVMMTAANQLRSEMQARAPVRTGWLRNNIVVGQNNPTEVLIKSLAHYSGHVNFGTFRMPPRPYFTGVIEEMGERAFTERFAQDSVSFLNQLIAKYQHGP